jgi:hypothetical protein
MKGKLATAKPQAANGKAASGNGVVPVASVKVDDLNRFCK